MGVCIVLPTDLDTLTPPAALRAWTATVDPAIAITGQEIDVDLDWWNTSLTARGLRGGPVTGTSAGSVTQTGKATITRGHVFDRAANAATDPDAALGLLWHALAWGSGNRYRRNHQRMDSIAADPAAAATALMNAARLSRTSPVKAYQQLYPHDTTAIKGLGPAFLTKYLYMAGGGDPYHPSYILDSRVAATLNCLGWTSLSPLGSWPAFTYSRYVNLLARWRTELATPDGTALRGDLIERWLFDQPSRPRPDGKHPVPELAVTTSPRSTWLWAADRPTALAVRAALDTAGMFWAPASQGQTESPLVTDIEIGVVALDACHMLAEEGFTFRWRDDQPHENRHDWIDALPGM